MNISAASEYGIRASLHLADAFLKDPRQLTTTEEIATSEKIPTKFLEALLRKLKAARLIKSQRGINGGHILQVDPSDIYLADIIRAIDGPLAAVRGERPESLKYSGSSKHLTKAWIAVRSSLRAVLEEISLTQVLEGKFPNKISKELSNPDAWARR